MLQFHCAILMRPFVESDGRVEKIIFCLFSEEVNWSSARHLYRNRNEKISRKVQLFNFTKPPPLLCELIEKCRALPPSTIISSSPQHRSGSAAEKKLNRKYRKYPFLSLFSSLFLLFPIYLAIFTIIFIPFIFNSSSARPPTPAHMPPSKPTDRPSFHELHGTYKMV